MCSNSVQQNPNLEDAWSPNPLDINKNKKKKRKEKRGGEMSSTVLLLKKRFEIAYGNRMARLYATVFTSSMKFHYSALISHVSQHPAVVLPSSR